MSAWTFIAHAEVGTGGPASITFSSIPASYTDLAILVSARSTRAANDNSATFTFNSSTSNFSGRYLSGDGSTTESGTVTNYAFQMPAANSTANTFGSVLIYIPNYTSTTTAKSYSVDSVTENNASSAIQTLVAGLWNPATQAAISSIVMTAALSAGFSQYSSATLFGITKGSSGGVTVS
jgi:hypothetical protein